MLLLRHHLIKDDKLSSGILCNCKPLKYCCCYCYHKLTGWLFFCWILCLNDTVLLLRRHLIKDDRSALEKVSTSWEEPFNYKTFTLCPCTSLSPLPTLYYMFFFCCIFICRGKPFNLCPITPIDPTVYSSTDTYVEIFWDSEGVYAIFNANTNVEQIANPGK